MTKQFKDMPIWSWKLLLALVLVGFLFLLPAGNNQVDAQGGCRAYHVVQYGENLYRISLRYNTTIPALIAANGITNPDRIYAGQTLCIPYGGGTGGLPVNGTVVNCYYLNVRSGPGVGYEVKEIVDRSTRVQVFGRNHFGTWVQIKTPNGTMGWVNASYVHAGVPIFSLPVVG